MHCLYRPKSDWNSLYRDVPHMLENTRKLVDDLSHVPFDIGSEPEPKNLKTYTGSARNDMALLKKLCTDGLTYRYPQCGREDRYPHYHKELEIIQDKGFVSYFLINWDIVNYARRKNYFYVGRGSGANSISSLLAENHRC
jgi:DNA polymerase III alpha subunit